MTLTSGRRRLLTRMRRSGSCVIRCPFRGRDASSRRTESVVVSWTDRNCMAWNEGKGNTRSTLATARRAPRRPPPPPVPPCPATPTPRPRPPPGHPQPPTGNLTMATGIRCTPWPRDVSADQSEDGLSRVGSLGI